MVMLFLLRTKETRSNALTALYTRAWGNKSQAFAKVALLSSACRLRRPKKERTSVVRLAAASRTTLVLSFKVGHPFDDFCEALKPLYQ